MSDKLRFQFKCRLTAEEAVLFDSIRDQTGLTTSQLIRSYVKEGMAKDSTYLATKLVVNGPSWTNNVRSFALGRYRHSN